MKAFSIEALRRKVTTFGIWRDERGIAAIEFALVVPLMLVMYLGTLEISGAVSINKKTSRVAATVADLVTQQTTVTTSVLDDIMKVGESVLFPYVSDKPDIWITAINVDSSYPQGGKAAWSRRYNKGNFETGVPDNEDVFVPLDLRIDGTFLIRVSTDIDYVPITNWLIGESVGTTKNGVGVIEMSERYYMRPRLGDDIPCPNC